MTHRDLPADLISASEKEVVRPFFAVDLEFDSPNALYFWNGYGSLSLGGNTYVGAGNLLNISEIRESSDLAANGATFTLSGIPSDLIALAIDEPYQGRVARVWLGMVDYSLTEPSFLLLNGTDYLLLESGGSRLSIAATQPETFFELFTGYMDQMNIEEGPETATISLSVENKMIDLNRPRVRRYTDNNQQGRFSGDLAFEFVNRIQNEDLTWGT